MFGMKKSGVNAYASVGLETGVVDASPLKLIVMLYDGAITACIHAKQAMAQHDIAKKGQYLTQAVTIVDSGLRACLDKRAGGDIAQKLDELYQYMTRSLMEASVRQDVKKVQEIQQLLMELKGAWEALEKTAITRPAQADMALSQMVAQKTHELKHMGQASRLATAGA
ncbi:flagellar export chaperone FliS [Methylophilus methylotrophus]|uniref:flagellar export chaperone FliS n=1 Tax=Methylophilus methylotrophus TaxID=17 RepID=UPI0003680D71|nr:flagellar export chaperone FliS [Methylophilus methylotrophus]